MPEGADDQETCFLTQEIKAKYDKLADTSDPTATRKEPHCS